MSCAAGQKVLRNCTYGVAYEEALTEDSSPAGKLVEQWKHPDQLAKRWKLPSVDELDPSWNRAAANAGDEPHPPSDS
jgi:predicted lipoprotein